MSSISSPSTPSRQAPSSSTPNASGAATMSPRKRKVASITLPSVIKKKKGLPSMKDDPELASIVSTVKVFVRLVHPFVHFLPLVMYAVHVWKMFADDDGNADFEDEDTIEHPTSKHKAHWVHWLWLRRHNPAIERRLAEVMDKPEQLSRLIAILDNAAVQGRADCVKSGKDRTPDYLSHFEYASSINKRDKYLRGFNNKLTGALVCPIGMEWLVNEEHTIALRTKGFTPCPTDLPQLLYRANGDYEPLPANTLREVPTFDIDADNLWDGFGEGFFLVSHFADLYASAVVKPDGQVVGIKGLTPEMPTGVTSVSIAWAAVVARLSADETSSFRLDPNSDVFSHEEFFNVIVSFLDNPHEVHQRDRLYRWYNRKFFPKLRHLHLEARTPNLLMSYQAKRAAERADQATRSTPSS